MKGAYCGKCNRFFYSNTLMHYCRKCGSLLEDTTMEYSDFTSLSAAERYKLAYKLTSVSLQVN